LRKRGENEAKDKKDERKKQRPTEKESKKKKAQSSTSHAHLFVVDAQPGAWTEKRVDAQAAKRPCRATRWQRVVGARAVVAKHFRSVVAHKESTVVFKT
jgi:hypothetical protein